MAAALGPRQAELLVEVLRVLDGQLDCPAVTVALDPNAMATLPKNGDVVAMHALPLPTQGACALQVGAPGTELVLGTQPQACLPFGMAR